MSENAKNERHNYIHTVIAGQLTMQGLNKDFAQGFSAKILGGVSILQGVASQFSRGGGGGGGGGFCPPPLPPPLKYTLQCKPHGCDLNPIL